MQQKWPILLPQGFGTYQTTVTPFKHICTFSINWELPRLKQTTMRTTIFFWVVRVTATAPSRDLTDNNKKEEGGLKQRRKQEEAAQGDPEPGEEKQEKEKDPSRVQS